MEEYNESSNITTFGFILISIFTRGLYLLAMYCMVIIFAKDEPQTPPKKIGDYLHWALMLLIIFIGGCIIGGLYLVSVGNQYREYSQLIDKILLYDSLGSGILFSLVFIISNNYFYKKKHG